MSISSARGVLVGDPDQAIFEFNGARPDLFDGFAAIPGAISLCLAQSLRCPSAIAAAANHLKDSSGQFVSARDQAGRAYMVRYKNFPGDIRKLVDEIRSEDRSSLIKVVARHNATVDAIVGRGAKQAPSLHCPSLTHIQRAVVRFRQGRNVAALAAAQAAIDRAVFGHEGATDQALADASIAPQDWRRLAARCLLRANDIADSGTCFEWQMKAGEILEKELGQFNLAPNLAVTKGKLKPQQRKGWQMSAATFLPSNSPEPHKRNAKITAYTVHGVKGETHDVTVYVCPPTGNDSQYPSTEWWSDKDNDREERRIAYVAMTRTQRDLVLCVSEDCYQRLLKKHPHFVNSFVLATPEILVKAVAESANQSKTVAAGVSH